MTANTTCQVPGCDRPIVSYKHRLCRPHQRRYYRTGVVGGPIKAYRQLEPVRIPADAATWANDIRPGSDPG